MELSREMRLLDKKWRSNQGWPKRLESILIEGLRGWTGQRVDFKFPITAIVGENGVGKSTVLQCAASSYKGRGKKLTKYPTDYFPENQWDKITTPSIQYWTREGDREVTGAMEKLKRWRGYSRRPTRDVQYIDLRRIQPLASRPGYWTLSKTLALDTYEEISSETFDESRLGRLNRVMGREYDSAMFVITKADKRKAIPILGLRGQRFSAFHHGAGEATMQELLKGDIPKNSLLLIDEAEASLHARVQRRLIRELAERCRTDDLQVILTTHSPIILEELPEVARVCIMEPPGGGRSVVYGVSPELAMTKLDDVQYYECEVFVEDQRALVMLSEIVAAVQPELMRTTNVVPSGAASVCRQLGLMVEQERWPRPVAVFLDGDQPTSEGCYRLPGDDSPERTIFEALKERRWNGISDRIGRDTSEVIDACDRAMTHANEHDWVSAAANPLAVGGEALWQAMCSVWATTILPREKAREVADAIQATVAGSKPPKMPKAIATGIASASAPATVESRRPAKKPSSGPSTGPGMLFEH